ncbi:hypothetical protein STTU_0336 [Streptomyces sp. Tu6071]|nr:hypothetical protein STTU_0336 [Streptomyces sp. Tu6071]
MEFPDVGPLLRERDTSTHHQRHTAAPEMADVYRAHPRP